MEREVPGSRGRKGRAVLVEFLPSPPVQLPEQKLDVLLVSDESSPTRPLDQLGSFCVWNETEETGFGEK